MNASAHWSLVAPRLSALAGLLILLSLDGPAAAQVPTEQVDDSAVATGSGPLETVIVAEQYEVPAIPEEGAPRFVPAGRLEVGDEVHYTIRVRNPGKEPVIDVQVSKRLPLGMHYVAGSAVGPACAIEYSIDEGFTFQPAADAEQLTHVRWTLHRPLAPGAVALLRFRAVFR